MHSAALRNKIDLPQTGYFTVQGIYYGWSILGLLWPAAVIMNGLLAFVVRSQMVDLACNACRALFRPDVGDLLFWTLPANQATANWTIVPENWKMLRRQWEYSHAVNTGIVFVAFCLTTISTLAWRPAGS